MITQYVHTSLLGTAPSIVLILPPHTGMFSIFQCFIPYRSLWPSDLHPHLPHRSTGPCSAKISVTHLPWSKEAISAQDLAHCSLSLSSYFLFPYDLQLPVAMVDSAAVLVHCCAHKPVVFIQAHGNSQLRNLQFDLTFCPGSVFSSTFYYSPNSAKRIWEIGCRQ